MRHRTITGLLLLSACIVAAPALAAEGRIPIWQPTLITDPGSYVVTRNITGPGTIIDVETEGVTIDLNGFVLETTDPTAAVIRLRPSPVDMRNDGGVSISGSGTLSGGTGVDAANISSFNIKTFRGEDLIHLLPDEHAIKSENIKEVMIGGVSAKMVAAAMNAAIRITNARKAHLSNLNIDGGNPAIELVGNLTGPTTGSAEKINIHDADGVAFNVINASGFSVKDFNIDEAASHGVLFQGCDACKAEDGAVQDAGGDGVRVENSIAVFLANLQVVRAVNGMFIDALSQGATVIGAGLHFSTTGYGLVNHGSQTHVNEGNFSGNPSGGVRNDGSQLSIQNSTGRGNGGPGLDDQGFDTWAEHNCLDT